MIMSYGHASHLAEMIKTNADQFATLYSGERAVLGEALINHDPHDQFAWCQEWRFAIADYLYFDKGEYEGDIIVPGFRPPSEPDTDSYAYQSLQAMEPDTESLLYAFNVLGRFREWLSLNGEDY